MPTIANATVPGVNQGNGQGTKIGRRCAWAFLTLCLLCGARAPAASGQQRPNIIFILADDLGYGDLGSYGQRQVQTPRLDRMAAEGMRFTQFYAGATVCAPSRSVLMTGKHLGHTRVRGNAGEDLTIQMLRPEDVTVAEVLKDAGYRTGLIGKWGLGDAGVGGLPNDQGFDYFFGYLNQVHAHNHYPEFLWRNQDSVALGNVVRRAPDSYAGFTGGYATVRADYTQDLFVDEALRFVEEAPDQPFFLYLSLTVPHANNEARFGPNHGMEVPDYGTYADRDWPEPQKGFAAMVSRMDDGVGRLLDQLERLGIDENTIVFFTSDNGPHMEGGNDPAFFDSNGPLRGVKRDLYEGGIRVPMIAWWPGRIAAGAVSDHIGYFGDVMATAAALSGAQAPDGLDSISFLPALLGRLAEQQAHDYLYWEFYERGSAQAVQQGRWKAVRSPINSGEIELYDLHTDIGEKEDVAAQRPDVVDALRKSMEEAHVPSPNWQVSAP